jgi:ABC-2 type transport system ATP-binding protein
MDTLLTVADVTQIRARNLTADCQNEIRQVIARHHGELMEMDNPSTTLEELFLSIVLDSEARPGRRANVETTTSA